MNPVSVPELAFEARMATVDPTVAGLASVHGCIGAVDPLRTFSLLHRSRSDLWGVNFQAQLIQIFIGKSFGLVDTKPWIHRDDAFIPPTSKTSRPAKCLGM